MNSISFKKNKFIIVALSVIYGCFSSANLDAQVVPDPSTIVSDSSETTTETTSSEPKTESVTESTTNVTPEPTDDAGSGSSGSGGGGGAIAILALAGLAVANISSTAKKPKIEKTFAVDSSGEIKVGFSEYHTDFLAKHGEIKQGFSMQIGSRVGVDRSTSLINLRLARKLATHLLFQSNLGTSWQEQKLLGRLILNDWFSVGLSKRNWLAKNDTLSLQAQYVSQNYVSLNTDVFGESAQLVATENFRGLFDKENTQIELSYLRPLYQTQQLTLSLAAYELNNQAYSKAMILWRKEL